MKTELKQIRKEIRELERPLHMNDDVVKCYCQSPKRKLVEIGREKYIICSYCGWQMKYLDYLKEEAKRKEGERMEILKGKKVWELTKVDLVPRYMKKSRGGFVSMYGNEIISSFLESRNRCAKLEVKGVKSLSYIVLELRKLIDREWNNSIKVSLLGKKDIYLVRKGD